MRNENVGWNAYMVPQTGEYFVFVSNDEFIEEVSRNEEVHLRLIEQIRRLSPLEPLYAKLPFKHAPPDIEPV
jgi:hypothetical protein